MKALNLLLSSKGFPVKDRTAALIGMKMRGGAEWQITTLTGSLPLTYESRTEHILKNYALYGSASGAGVETKNLCDCTTFAAGHLDGAGNVVSASNTTYVNGLPDGSIEFTTNAAWRGVHTEKFLIPIGATTIRFSYLGLFNNNQYRFCFYDSNGDFASQSTRSGANRFTITVPNGAASVAISIQLSTATTYKFTKLRLYTDLDTTTDFVPYGYQIPLTNTGENSQSETYPLYIGSTKLGEEEYLDYESGKVYKRTEQLFNKDAKDTEKGYVNGYRLRENGTLSSGSSFAVSEFIKIEPNTDYYLVWIYTGSTLGYCLYGSDKQYLSGSTYASYGESATGGIVTTGNASYIRFTINKSVADSIMLIEGSTAPTQHIPYLQPTDPPAPLPAITAYAGENTISSTETVGEAEITGRIKSII